MLFISLPGVQLWSEASGVLSICSAFAIIVS